ncbi:DNA mismatch repair protein MutL [Desulfuromusa kysingii]|uniref:DNA mismatch repair protein MutL n=1 Tax=Desulfuromusa kysingii TaxID=37625 RepID=A0A1H4CZB7_9BACT|nr:DNA mismatch repair endonuclease MutL [Desulfuromusa kysingii]SEA65853.1 DNA mismatch repair protein MutL [Desulfuromusa kysingii]
METKIHVLPEDLCNKIAAGEVVERPSSVVKELLENSLDSGASNILIELEAGGKRLIRVTDDGCGMSRQDAFLSFERHATSKIRTDADLFALHTLGFRGEAMASIASVSRLRLKTCASQDGLGQQIYVEGGKIKSVTEVGLPQGTVVEVRNLFFNLPARKKFLRKEQTELGHAADVVTKQAMANPTVSIRLKHNDRTLLDLRREKGVRERVAALLGRSVLNDLLAVEQQAGDDLQLSALISQPQLTRSAASHIYTFINGRYIRDRIVQHAVMDGYRHLLMKGRYPVVILFLKIDPAQVDVNVHPTKHEVRFREQSLVHDFIAKSLQQALSPATWLTQLPETPDQVPRMGLQTEAPVHRDDEAVKNDSVRETHGHYAPPIANMGDPLPEADIPAVNSPFDEPVRSTMDTAAGQYSLPGSEAQGFFSGLQILGQYHQSYILCQDRADLVLIDQHAAHERVGFEKLRHAYAAGEIPSQTLLFPEVLELDFNSATALNDNQSELEKLGFEVEPFGGKSFALKAVPLLLADSNVAGLVVDVALELARIGRTGQLRESIDDILIMMACHSVIRANQALETVEIKALFRALDQIDFKANCPHGRPVVQRMTLSEVERLFRRK